MAFDRQTFVIYDEEYHTGAIETLERVSFNLNESAGGVFKLVTQNMRGEFLKESFFKDIDGIVRDRDPNDLTSSTADDLEMGEEIGVKIHKSIHVEKAINAFKGIGASPEEFSFIVGQIHGKRMAVDYLDTAIASCTAVLLSNANVQYDATAVSGKETISPANLNRIKRKLGDAATRITAWVMDATMYHDLVEENITSKYDFSGFQIYGGSPGSLGLPVIVTDSPYLLVEGDSVDDNVHYVLGLTENACTLFESEDFTVHTDVVGRLKNLIGLIQVEYALTPRVAGAAYSGSEHPTKADLADSANWGYVVADKAGIGALGMFNPIV